MFTFIFNQYDYKNRVRNLDKQTNIHTVIPVSRFDGTFEITVPDDAVDTQNTSESLDSDTKTSLSHERMHLTIPRGVHSDLFVKS